MKNQKPRLSIYRYSQQRNLPRKQHRLSLWLTLAVVVALTISSLKIANSSHVTAKSAVLSAQTISPTLITSMGQQINQVIAQYPDVQTAVSITNLNTDKSYNYGVSAPFEAASIGKLITATLFLHQVESGQQSLSETLNGSPAQHELNLMIEQSDNDAWTAFNGLLGHATLESWTDHIGFRNYDADQNTLPANDVALLLTKLYQHKLLNTHHTQLLLSYMQNSTETAYIVDNVPVGVKVYHKAGWLDDRVHDAAIIDNGKNPYVLVIFTKVDGAYNTAVGMQIFKDITNASVTTFIKS